MVDIRVAESFRYRGGKVLQFFPGQGECGNDFLVDGFIHKAPDNRIFHTVTDDILSCKVSAENHRSMGAVKDTYLALLIGLMILRYQNGEACLFKR